MGKLPRNVIKSKLLISKNKTTPTLVSTERRLCSCITLDDEGMYTIYAGYRGNTKNFFEDIYVRFSPGDTREDDFIEVAVPVVDNDDCDVCKNGNCDDCPHIYSYQLYLIGRDGCISEEIEMLEDDD